MLISGPNIDVMYFQVLITFKKNIPNLVTSPGTKVDNKSSVLMHTFRNIQGQLIFTLTCRWNSECMGTQKCVFT